MNRSHGAAFGGTVGWPLVLWQIEKVVIRLCARWIKPLFVV